VAQDYCGMREALLGDEILDRLKKKWPEAKFGKRGLIILHYFVDGKKTGEIAEITGYTQRRVQQVIADSLRLLGVS
jgi:DNA-binding NarL/FixJ family response regulator